MEIHYEPHPVTAERMAELRKRGVRVLDAKFKPKGEKPAESQPAPKKKRKSKE